MTIKAYSLIGEWYHGNEGLNFLLTSDNYLIQLIPMSLNIDTGVSTGPRIEVLNWGEGPLRIPGVIPDGKGIQRF